MNEEKSFAERHNKTTLHDLIKELGLDSKKVIAAKFKGEAHDLSYIPSEGGEVEPITVDSPE